MGDVADAMLGGELCEMCGVYLEGEAEGIPRYCSAQCAKDRGAAPEQVVVKAKHSWVPQPKKPKAQCPVCKQWIKQVGMTDHVRDKHEPKVVADVK